MKIKSLSLFSKIFTVTVFVSVLFLGNANFVFAADCPAIAPYQCNNGSCVNEPSLCSQSWGGGLANTPANSTVTTSTSSPTSTSVSTQTCTGNLRYDQAAAQACAALAEAQGRALGYNISCSVDSNPEQVGVNGNPTGPVLTSFNGSCTINGQTGFSPETLAGYTGSGAGYSNPFYLSGNAYGAGFNINPGWRGVGCSLVDGALGTVGGGTLVGTASCPSGTAQVNAVINSVSGSGTTGGGTVSATGASTPTGSAAARTAAYNRYLEQKITDMQKSILSISQDLYKNFLMQFGQSSPQNQALVDDLIARNNQKSQSGQIPSIGNVIAGQNNPYNPGGTKPPTGTGTGTLPTPSPTPTPTPTNTGCYIFTTTMQLGNAPITHGPDILKLVEALKVAGFLASPLPQEFDKTVENAVKAYQEKYASEILTPLGLTSGTGIVSTNTRAHLNKMCWIKNTVPSDDNPTGKTILRIETSDNTWIAWREIEAYAGGVKLKAVGSQAPNQLTGNEKEKSYDGDVNTSWNSGPNPSSWFEVYYPAGLNIDRVRILEEGNTITKVVKVSVGTVGNMKSFAQFDPPIRTQFWLEYPIPTETRPDPTITASANGQANLDVVLDTSEATYYKGLVYQNVLWDWKATNADYIKLTKKVEDVPSFGSYIGSAPYDTTCPSVLAYKQGQPWPALYNDNQFLYRYFFLEPYLFALVDEEVLGSAVALGSKVENAVNPCHTGKRYTYTFEAIQKNSGKKASFDVVVNVKKK
jgi:hypothetical protein